MLQFLRLTKGKPKTRKTLFFIRGIYMSTCIFVMINKVKSFKGGSRHRDCCMARALSFLIRYFSNYYTLHRSDLAARAAPLDPRLERTGNIAAKYVYCRV